jgi:cytochrome c
MGSLNHSWHRLGLMACLAGFVAGVGVLHAQHAWPGCDDLKAGDFRKINILDKNKYPGLNEPIKMALAKDGRLFWIERAGAVKRWDPKTTTMVTLLEIDVYLNNTRGGMGITLDPAFESNSWIYVVYTPNRNPFGTFRLSRFSLAGDKLQDEKIVLDLAFAPGAGQHASGALAWDNDGNLFWGTGDETSPANISGISVDGYAPIVNQEPKLDARRSSGNTNDLNGKILRIHPEADGKYSIPKGNLFSEGTALTRPEIYSMGHRNPWTLWFDRPTGWLFVGEVGPDATGENGGKGPAAQDELNVVKNPGNYGWPFLGGQNIPYNNYDYVANKSGALFNPNALENLSPNNTGLKTLPAARPALLAYGHDGKSSDQGKFPLLAGANSGTAIGGPVYRYDPNLDSKVKLPPHFNNVWFFGDWMRNWWYAANLDSTASSVTAVKKPFAGISFDNVIAGAIGPEGALYLIEYGNAYFTSPNVQKISRIEYTGNCLPSQTTGLDDNLPRHRAQTHLEVKLEQGHILWVSPKYGTHKLIDAQGRY